MRTTIRFLLLFAAYAAAATPARAQADVRADTLRGADFSDGVIAEALGLPRATDEHVGLARSGMRCGQTNDAVLCNAAVAGRAWEECADVALVGQFIVWFELLGGRPTDKRVYVAVTCGEQTVTVSSRNRFPATEFELSRRQNGAAREESRRLVFITTGR